ncbi:MAG: tetratricopeptide repeat protein [Verrucomicrobiae bacterium]|nr:tetratricopeptide repeat protein [Verrucomicrobiae bacterium]
MKRLQAIFVAATGHRAILGVLLLFVLVFVVYAPILPGSFLLDDHRLIKEDNALVNGELSPLTFWFQTDFTLSAVGWWLQWLAWGEHPGPYHAVNIALHGLSAVLLWRLLARLKIPGAFLAAALFAVHPVCVNSVARVSELKNTLSLPFFILSFWLYLRYEALRLIPAVPGRRDGAPWWLAAALITFILAALSKTSTLMLPVVLLACALWQRRRITRQDLFQTTPFFILALAFGLMSVWFQKHQAMASAGQTLPHESVPERLAIAGHVLWFYLGKALVPVNLNLFYKPWKPDMSAFGAFLPVILLLATFAVCWHFRKQWGWHVLFALGCFVVMLFPVLGFFDSQYMVTWQVSDHLQYLPLIAPVALVAALLAYPVNLKQARAADITVVLALAFLTFQRSQVFATQEKLMRDSLAKNPGASLAQSNLGTLLAEKKNYAEASEHFAAALRLNPADETANANLAQILAMQGKFAGAEPLFLAAIRSNPEDPAPHKQYARALQRQGRIQEAIHQLELALCFSPRPDGQTHVELAGMLHQSGNPRQAIVHFRKALAVSPDQTEPMNNLAWLLATSSENALRDGVEAVRLAERACHLTEFKETRALSTLAAAYAEAGRFTEAISTAEMAVKMQMANGEYNMAALNNQLLPLYRSGLPYHERAAGL